jgi:starch synthase
LKILMLSAEVSPFAKVGGLADVVGSLPKDLRRLGHDCRVIMPAYAMIENNPDYEIKTVIAKFTVRMNPTWTKEAYLKEIVHSGVTFYLLGTDEWFGESTSSQTVYLPGSDQHLFFSKAILTAMNALGWTPDIIHCNDWHTGFTPVLMREMKDKTWDQSASVFTIHNLAYQGEFDADVLKKLDLPMELFNLHQLETYGRVNFLKAGCVYADQVNTVSPTYAQEIQTPEYGCRLEGLMKHLADYDRLSGILNGIDYDEFNPETDPCIPAHFSASSPEGKAACKAGVLAELGLRPIKGSALMGVVSRLSSQKGMDLMLETAQQLFALKAQLIIQGLGDPWLAGEFRNLQDAFPDNFRFVEKFDASLAQRVYAGSDIFLMPSSFEPCGLGQLIAMRYGTIPLVRKTGGLADTVFDGLNGFVFEERSSAEFLATCKRAVTTFGDPDKWTKLVHSAMTSDHSWERSACEYVEMYEKALEDRRNSLLKGVSVNGGKAS